MSENKEYYTTIQTAKLLGVSVRTVQLWVENSTLEAWKTAGGHRRIVAQSVDDYIQRQSTSNTAKADSKRILIVEDNPTVCKFYEAAIKSWNLPIDVIVKQDGFDGLVEIGRQTPDLLIADIYMPGMDGLQMIRSLYKSEQMASDRIIVISGLSSEEIAERGGVPSDVQFFNKPVNVEALKSGVLSKLSLSDEPQVSGVEA
ncbi:MAG: response regulator [Acidiferrobacterales bacterium]|nr:response regulator [Acidiferrobacterales bacterium]